MHFLDRQWQHIIVSALQLVCCLFECCINLPIQLAAHTYIVCICDWIWQKWLYADYFCFELLAKIYTQLTYMVFQIITPRKKYYPLPSSCHTSSHWSRSFGPLVPPLFGCNWEMLTWHECFYDNGSGSTSVIVLPLACSYNQTALQVVIDISKLFQEDSRIAVNCHWTVQRTRSFVCVSASHMIASVYIVYKNHCYTIIVL